MWYTFFMFTFIKLEDSVKKNITRNAFRWREENAAFRYTMHLFFTAKTSILPVHFGLLLKKIVYNWKNLLVWEDYINLFHYKFNYFKNFIQLKVRFLVSSAVTRLIMYCFKYWLSFIANVFIHLAFHVTGNEGERAIKKFPATNQDVEVHCSHGNYLTNWSILKKLKLSYCSSRFFHLFY